MRLSLAALAAAALAAAALAAPAAVAEPTFSSTSNGSDGALDYTGVASGTTVVFDPAAHDPPLDTDGDNVFHFTTITIPQGVTVKLWGYNLHNQPVYWLATGDVTIAGTLDLGGAAGHPGEVTSGFGPSQPGPGGYPGGAGTTNRNLGTAQAGFGPGSGDAGLGSQENTRGSHSGGPKPYGNAYLLPLLGGSGGGGSSAGGGAGGGAILLASSTKISVTGLVSARGGNSGDGGTGSGGAIRLMAPTIDGGGILDASGGGNLWNTGFGGWVRIEAFQDDFIGQIPMGRGGVYLKVTLAPTSVLGLPSQSTGQVSLNFASIGGASVPAKPTASYLNPDVVLTSSEPLSIVVDAANIPPGTVVHITTYNETLGGGSVDATLTGTLSASAGTATIAAPPGFTTFYAYATWGTSP